MVFLLKNKGIAAFYAVRRHNKTHGGCAFCKIQKIAHHTTESVNKRKE